MKKILLKALAILLLSSVCYGDCIEDAKNAYTGDKNFNKVGNILKKGCEGGNDSCCMLLVKLFRTEGFGDKNNVFLAKKIFEKNCNNGTMTGCTGLGFIFNFDIQGVTEADQFKANKFFKKACDNNEPTACGMLAQQYLNGRGVRQDDVKTTELYKKACDGNVPVYCFNLGHRYKCGEYDGNGARNSQKALELYGKACDLGYQPGCESYRLCKQKMKK